MSEFASCGQCNVMQRASTEYRTLANGYTSWRDPVCKTCRQEEVKVRKRKRQTLGRVFPETIGAYVEGNCVVRVLPPAAGFM